MEKTVTLPRLVREDVAADYLGERSVASMQRDRALGRGPRYVKIGRLVRYRGLGPGRLCAREPGRPDPRLGCLSHVPREEPRPAGGCSMW